MIRSALWAAGVLAFLAGCRGSEPSPSRRLNVLFIVADDLNTDLGCYGHPLVRSPHIDRLAAAGVRFDRAYCQSAWCAPSRASLLTGLRPYRGGVLSNGLQFRKQFPDHPTLPQLFRNEGYFTARVGKIYHTWSGYPTPQSKPVSDDPASWDVALDPWGREKGQDDKLIRYEPQKPNLGASLSWAAFDGPDEDMTDGRVATEAIRLMTESKDRPFFLGVGFYKPHVPCVAPRGCFDLYPLEKIALPRHRAAPEGAPAAAMKDAPKVDDEQQRHMIRAYYAAVTHVDNQVGRLMAALTQLNLVETTIVVFFGDHGFHLGEHGLWEKVTLFERSVRAPLILVAPGAAGTGKPSPRTVEFLDLYPTLADLAGLPAPKRLEGRSLRPLLADPAAPWPHPAYCMERSVSKGVLGLSVRTERFRYTEWDQGRAGVELYDYETDAEESRNRAQDPAYSADAARLKQLLRDHR